MQHKCITGCVTSVAQMHLEQKTQNMKEQATSAEACHWARSADTWVRLESSENSKVQAWIHKYLKGPTRGRVEKLISKLAQQGYVWTLNDAVRLTWMQHTPSVGTVTFAQVAGSITSGRGDPEHSFCLPSLSTHSSHQLPMMV